MNRGTTQPGYRGMDHLLLFTLVIYNCNCLFNYEVSLKLSSGKEYLSTIIMGAHVRHTHALSWETVSKGNYIMNQNSASNL